MGLEYITDEEIDSMSEEEFLSWIEEIDRMEETVVGRMQKDGYKMPRLSLSDLDKAYTAPEFKGLLDRMEDVDYPATVFEDKDDVDDINEAYQKVKKLSDKVSNQDKENAYMPLYAKLYPYIRRVNPLWGEGALRLSVWSSLQKEFTTVYTLNEDSIKPFKNLISKDDIVRIGMDNVYTLGSVRFKNGQKTAAGVLMFTVFAPEDKNDEPVARIDWLFVADEFRGDHVADDLMAAMYDTLNKAGVTAVTCEVPAVDLLPVMVCDFLSAWSIFFSLEPFEDFNATLGEVISYSSLSGKISDKVSFSSLKDMGNKKFSAEIQNIMKEAGVKDFKLDEIRTLEPDISLIAKSPSGGKAFLLVDQTPSGALKIRKMTGNPSSKKLFLDMLKAAVKSANGKYDPQTKIIAQISSDVSAKLLDYMFPDHGLPMHLVGANLTAQEDFTPEIFEYLRYMYEQEKENPQ